MQIHNELITGRILFQSMNTLYDHGKQSEAYDIYVDCIFFQIEKLVLAFS